ncbi:CpsD/CapB family tyrosine-protein kinase [Tropicimonas sp.]|uniref:CpsD/CapB family tyrosine-protein kinase n=1 Tax=Tropicimonas sp. TaxID=2067044 RepID=UPI003A88605E
MDRLQLAIQKARAQRAEAAHQPAPAAAPAAPGAAGPLRNAPATPAPATLWDDLEPLDSTAPALRRNRLIAVDRGRGAAPYDLLRTRMLHQVRMNGWRRIGIVSPTSGCGKTTAAANLAFAFSRQADIRVMVLDFDLRRPKLAEILGQKPRHGMEDVLTGRIPFAEHGCRIGDNVALGLNNGPAHAPSELLQSQAAIQQIATIEATYAPDLVLIDLPPMMAIDDSFGFLGNTDAALVMVAAEQSTMAEIEVTIRQIEELTQVMGVILNKCRYTRGAYSYDSKGYYN